MVFCPRLNIGRVLKFIVFPLCLLGVVYTFYFTELPKRMIREVKLDRASIILHDDGKHDDIVKDVTKKHVEEEDFVESFPSSSVTITTSIRHHVDGHGIGRIYDDEPWAFYWGRDPRPGDHILLMFNEVKQLKSLIIPSGKKDHEEDAFVDTTLSVSDVVNTEGRCDKFRDVATFHNKMLIDHKFAEGTRVQCVRLTLDTVRTLDNGDAYWLVVNGITIT